jgi:hypothetical protein
MCRKRKGGGEGCEREKKAHGCNWGFRPCGRCEVWVKCMLVCQFLSGSSVDASGNEKAAIVPYFVIIMVSIGSTCHKWFGALCWVAGRARGRSK